MSPTAQGWIVAVCLLTASPRPAAAQCTAADRAALETTAELVPLAAFDTADDQLRHAFEQAPGCDALGVAAWSVRGWRAARAARHTGGRLEDLAPAREAIERLTQLGPSASAAGYAIALVRAASAAAQDERDELSVWLDHARDLAGRLAIGGVAPHWPLPFDDAEGELWLDVDDFEQAEAAFTRAVAARRGPASWRGLARALERQGKAEAACDAYRHVLSTLNTTAIWSPLRAEAKAAIAACP